MEIMLSHLGVGVAYDALDGLNVHAQRLHLRHIGVAAAVRREQADIARFFQRFAEYIPEMGGVAGQAGFGTFPDELVGGIPQLDGTGADIQRHRNIPDTVFGFRTADADRTFYDLYCLPDVNDRAIFFNKLRLQSQKFLHSHSSAEQKPDAQAHAVIGQHLHQVCDFRCGKGFLALCGSGCPHLFSKPDRVTAHKVIGFCLLKDLVEHPSCLADVRIRAAIAPHPFQEVFDVDGAYDGQGAMVKSLFEHFQAVFIAFLCRGSDIILVTLEPCICPILEVQNRVQLDTADKRMYGGKCRLEIRWVRCPARPGLRPHPAYR